MSSMHPVTEAFQVFAPYGSWMLTRRGTLLAVVELEGVDPDALTRADLSHVALTARQVAEQLPPGAAASQYYVHLDRIPVHLRDRADPLRHRLSKARERFLNDAGGLARSFLFHVYEFGSDRAATGSLGAEIRDQLAGGFLEPEARRRFIRRLRTPDALLLSREGLARLARDATDQLDKIVAIWGKLGAARVVAPETAFGLLRYLASFDPAHLLAPPRVVPEDDMDLALAAGDIEPVEIGYDAFLKLHGAETRYLRIGSVTTLPRQALGWLTEGVDAPIARRGDYVIVHSFEPMSEITRALRFSEARAAIERTRMSLVNMIRGETTTEREEWRPKYRAKLDAIARAEAEEDRWGLVATTLLVPDRDPVAATSRARDFARIFAARGIGLVWEALGLPFAFQAVQPGGAGASRRRSIVTSSRHGSLALAFKARTGQETVADLGQEEAGFIFETASGEPFHFSPFVGGRGFVIGVGPVRSGKTFLKNTLATHFLKYGGLVRAVDIDPGARCVAEIFSTDGAGYCALGDAGALNPFVSQQDGEDADFATHLGQLLALMLEANDTPEMRRVSAEEQADIDQSIRAVMALDPALRSMRALHAHLHSDTRRLFDRWFDRGMYAGILDAEADAIGRIDHPFAAWNLGAYRDRPQVLRPVLLDLFWRVTRAFEDPARRGVPKMLEIDEAHHALSIPVFRDYVTAKVRTWGKWQAGVTLWTQSPAEYGQVPEWSAIRSAASTFFFMADGRMDEDQYRRVFGLRDGDIAAIRRLVPRREAYLVQPDLDIRKVVTLRVDPEQHVINTSHPREAQIRDRLIAEHGRDRGLVLAAAEIARLGTSRVEVPSPAGAEA